MIPHNSRGFSISNSAFWNICILWVHRNIDIIIIYKCKLLCVTDSPMLKEYNNAYFKGL